MSDTFYARQANGGSTAKRTTPVHKKRKLKKDVIAEVNSLLSKEIAGLDKCTIATLEDLINGIKSI